MMAKIDSSRIGDVSNEGSCGLLVTSSETRSKGEPTSDIMVPGKIHGEDAIMNASGIAKPGRRPAHSVSGLPGEESSPAREGDSHPGASFRASTVSRDRCGQWLGESHVSGLHLSGDYPQSMLLSADQNTIMRIPNFGSFMHQQENLQALLVDIHEDPKGFTTFVEDRREALGVLGEATVAALSTGEGRLTDYEGLQQVGKGRFSTVFYAETKDNRIPCAIKRIQLSSSDSPQGTQDRNGGREGRAGELTAGRGKGAALVNSANGPDAGGRIGNRRRRKKKKGMTYEQCLKEVLKYRDGKVGLLKSLKSPNIVRLHTCFLEESVLWVVMEWVDGGDLSGVLSRTRQARERLNELAVWAYFTQICDALLHMHGQRIMHRDLKPANVLVCLDGTVKLGDLGLGRYLHARSALAMSQVGTPLYMSPETLQGQGHEMVSDIWSLGCVLYELAMLSSPFAARHLTMDKLFSKIVRADYLPVDKTFYSERLSNLVDHLLVPDPRLRPKIDMVQPASHLALQAQRNGVQGLDAEQLAVCASEIQGEYNLGNAVPHQYPRDVEESPANAAGASPYSSPRQPQERQQMHPQQLQELQFKGPQQHGLKTQRTPPTEAPAMLPTPENQRGATAGDDNNQDDNEQFRYRCQSSRSSSTSYAKTEDGGYQSSRTTHHSYQQGTVNALPTADMASAAEVASSGGTVKGSVGLEEPRVVDLPPKSEREGSQPMTTPAPAMGAGTTRKSTNTMETGLACGHSTGRVGGGEERGSIEDHMLVPSILESSTFYATLPDDDADAETSGSHNDSPGSPSAMGTICNEYFTPSHDGGLPLFNPPGTHGVNSTGVGLSRDTGNGGEQGEPGGHMYSAGAGRVAARMTTEVPACVAPADNWVAEGMAQAHMRAVPSGEQQHADGAFTHEIVGGSTQRRYLDFAMQQQMERHQQHKHQVSHTYISEKNPLMPSETASAAGGDSTPDLRAYWSQLDTADNSGGGTGVDSSAGHAGGPGPGGYGGGVLYPGRGGEAHRLRKGLVPDLARDSPHVGAKRSLDPSALTKSGLGYGGGVRQDQGGRSDDYQQHQHQQHQRVQGETDSLESTPFFEMLSSRTVNSVLRSFTGLSLSEFSGDSAPAPADGCSEQEPQPASSGTPAGNSCL